MHNQSHLKNNIHTHTHTHTHTHKQTIFKISTTSDRREEFSSCANRMQNHDKKKLDHKEYDSFA